MYLRMNTYGKNSDSPGKFAVNKALETPQSTIKAYRLNRSRRVRRGALPAGGIQKSPEDRPRGASVAKCDQPLSQFHFRTRVCELVSECPGTSEGEFLDPLEVFEYVGDRSKMVQEGGGSFGTHSGAPGMLSLESPIRESNLGVDSGGHQRL